MIRPRTQHWKLIACLFVTAGLIVVNLVKSHEVNILESSLLLTKKNHESRALLLEEGREALMQTAMDSKAREIRQVNRDLLEIITGNSYLRGYTPPDWNQIDTSEFLSEACSTIVSSAREATHIYTSETDLELEYVITHFSVELSEELYSPSQWVLSKAHRFVVPIKPLVWNEVTVKHGVDQVSLVVTIDGKVKVLAEFPGWVRAGDGRSMTPPCFFGNPEPDEQGIWYSLNSLCKFELKSNLGEPKSGYQISVIYRRSSK